ncbi:MAG: DUF1844 domain-containing protein [Planctomycetota bacterium]
MSNPDDQPLLHIDDDWKAQAQAEKQKLAEKQRSTPQADRRSDASDSSGAQALPPSASTSAGRGKIPPADFQTLVQTIASQALFAMGAMPDPQTGQRFTDLDIARHHIDTLGVVEEKTQGNLTDEEGKLLAGTLYELRSTYVQVANATRSPATGGPAQ